MIKPNGILVNAAGTQLDSSYFIRPLWKMAGYLSTLIDEGKDVETIVIRNWQGHHLRWVDGISPWGPTDSEITEMYRYLLYEYPQDVILYGCNVRSIPTSTVHDMMGDFVRVRDKIGRQVSFGLDRYSGKTQEFKDRVAELATYYHLEIIGEGMGHHREKSGESSIAGSIQWVDSDPDSSRPEIADYYSPEGDPNQYFVINNKAWPYQGHVPSNSNVIVPHNIFREL